jgi:hypothetical protein
VTQLREHTSQTTARFVAWEKQLHEAQQAAATGEAETIEAQFELAGASAALLAVMEQLPFAPSDATTAAIRGGARLFEAHNVQHDGDHGYLTLTPTTLAWTPPLLTPCNKPTLSLSFSFELHEIEWLEVDDGSGDSDSCCTATVWLQGAAKYTLHFWRARAPNVTDHGLVLLDSFEKVYRVAKAAADEAYTQAEAEAKAEAKAAVAAAAASNSSPKKAT